MLPKIVLLPRAFSIGPQKVLWCGGEQGERDWCLPPPAPPPPRFPLSSSDSISPTAFLLSRPYSYLPFEFRRSHYGFGACRRSLVSWRGDFLFLPAALLQCARSVLGHRHQRFLC